MLAELDQVKKQYKDFTLDCSMKIQEDCVTGLIGANGAGKSTTFKMLLGLVQPDSGEIRIFGKNRKDLSENDRRELGTVLSDSFFSGYLTVAQMMSFMGDFYPEFQKKEFQTLLKEMLELETKEAKLYNALDKMEAVIQHNETDIRSWIPLEYELQFTYGEEEVKFSEYLIGLKKYIDAWTQKKIAEEKSKKE